MAHRVIQWATGNVGAHSLRALIANPQFQLVGVLVYDKKKNGRDVGELCGIAPVGIQATTDVEKILAIDADCVAYNALGETKDPGRSLEDICRLLESGKNVVSTAVSRHIHPNAMSPEDRRRLEEACRKGQASFHSTGINPGFSFDVLPICLSAIANRIDRIHVVEVVDMSGYTSKSIVSGFIGMGLPPDVDAPADGIGDLRNNAFFTCFSLVADALHLTYSDFTLTREKAVTPTPLDLPWGRIPPNTVAARRVRMEGLLNGAARIVYELVWRVSNDVAPDWPSGKAHYELAIEGDPTLRCRLDIASSSGRSISLVTAMHAVNAIPSVCAARPGIRTCIDFPLMGGGFFPVGSAQTTGR